jgi:hypothetical protein
MKICCSTYGQRALTVERLSTHMKPNQLPSFFTLFV